MQPLGNFQSRQYHAGGNGNDARLFPCLFRRRLHQLPQRPCFAFKKIDFAGACGGCGTGQRLPAQPVYINDGDGVPAPSGEGNDREGLGKFSDAAIDPAVSHYEARPDDSDITSIHHCTFQGIFRPTVQRNRMRTGRIGGIKKLPLHSPSAQFPEGLQRCGYGLQCSFLAVEIMCQMDGAADIPGQAGRQCFAKSPSEGQRSPRHFPGTAQGDCFVPPALNKSDKMAADKS